MRAGRDEPIRRVDLAPARDFVAAARMTMGGVDLDPYSNRLINQLVLARRFYDRDSESLESILAKPWQVPDGRRILVAPPVGAAETRGLIAKTLREYRKGHIEQACLLLSHNETVRTAPWIWDFPVCIPFRRLRPCYWDDELDNFRNISPSGWSLIVYLPPILEASRFHDHVGRFHQGFSHLGRIVFNEYSGEDSWREAYKLLTGKTYSEYN